MEKSHQNTQNTLSEHIDVLLLGSRVSRFLQLLFPQRKGSFSSPKPAPTYLQFIKSLFGNVDPQAQQVQMPGALHLGVMTRITKNVFTKHLWLAIHLHYPNQQFYDPLVTDFLRGCCRIAIIIHENSATTNNNNSSNKQESAGHHPEDLQKLVGNSTKTAGTFRFDNKEVAGNSKHQQFYENRMLAAVHKPKLASLDCVLSLTLEQDSRLYESSSGIEVTINQVCRWVAERHFELQHRVKLAKNFGDQIETQMPQKIYACSIF